MNISASNKKKWLVVAVIAAAAAAAWWGWIKTHDTGPGAGFASGNGRLEATEIDVSTKMAGRVVEILAREGDTVKAGQPLVRMQIDTLNAQRSEAVANLQRSQHTVAAAQAQVKLRESDVAAAMALERQREAELDAARRRLGRSQTLVREGATSQQQLDDDLAAVRGAQAALAATKAQTATARAAVEAAKAELVGTQSGVEAGKATIQRIDADINDSELVAPRDGRVQLRLAEPGEVVGAGGRVLNLLDLTDVYMTFFLPETVAGRLAIGTEARLVLDAAPNMPVPATITFVASSAQFTPKTVETASERQKLMFRVKAQIPASLLRKYPDYVKVGLPGVAWVKLDPKAPWPASLTTGLAK